MTKNTAPSSDQIYQVFEALDTVIQDAAELNHTVTVLSQDSEELEDQDDLLSMADEDRGYLASRWDYAIGSISGKTVVKAHDLVEASEKYKETIEDLDPEEADARARFLTSVIANALYSRKEDLGLGTRKNKVLKGHSLLTSELESEQRTFPVILGRVVKFTPHESKHGKIWVSMTDPRVLKANGVNTHAQEKVVTRHTVTSVEDDGDDRIVIFKASDQSLFPLEADQVARYSDRSLPAHSRPVGEVVYDEDGKPYWKPAFADKKVRIIPEDDTYKLSDDGKTLIVFIPAGRTSIEERGAIVFGDMLDKTGNLQDGEAGKISVQAAAGPQRHITETYRPINTGNPNDPQVNPRPIQTAKRN